MSERQRCVLVIPLAAICGPLRGIPLFWMPVDMSFGIIGIVPLILPYRHIRVLEADAACCGSYLGGSTAD